MAADSSRWGLSVESQRQERSLCLRLSSIKDSAASQEVEHETTEALAPLEDV